MGRGRRNTELGLLLMTTLIIVGAYVLVSLSDASEIPPNIGPFLGVILGVQIVGHVTIRKYAPDADPTLFPLASLLNGLGYVFIVRIDEAKASPAGLAGQQAIWVIIGIGVFVATLWWVRETRMLERYRYTAGLAGLVLLALPLLPVLGREINGARIWVSFGPVNFQPGEFAKLAMALFFAGYLYEKRELLAITRKVGPVSLPDPKYMAPLLMAWGMAMIVMVRQNELGTALLLFTLFTVLIWVATERASYLFISVGLFFTGTWFAFSHFRHARQRLDLWGGFYGDLTSSDTGQGATQLDEGAFALAEGGITGVGLGLGSPTMIPEVETDFIFAAIGEELGLFGGTAILFTFLLMVGTGLRIAQQQATSGFDRLFAVGLATLIGFQTFIIVAGVTKLLPLTGITLPFVSYGGSSLLANYVLVALLLRMSDTTSRLQAEQEASGDVTSLVEQV